MAGKVWTDPNPGWTGERGAASGGAKPGEGIKEEIPHKIWTRVHTCTKEQSWREGERRGGGMDVPVRLPGDEDAPAALS